VCIYSHPAQNVINACSLEEFTGLMKGQIAAKDIDDEKRSTFAVFGKENINIDMLKHMVQVSNIILSNSSFV
jgi:hypothetical protein